MSAGRFLRAQPHRAAPAASGLALLSSRLHSVSAGVLSSPPVGRGYMARGGWGRGEPRCPPLPSPRQRSARPCLPHSSAPRPLFTGLARPGRRGLGAPPPPWPVKGLGGGETVGGGGGLVSPPRSRPQRWAAEARSPPPQLPHTPSRPSLPAGHSGKEEAARGPSPATTVS